MVVIVLEMGIYCNSNVHVKVKMQVGDIGQR